MRYKIWLCAPVLLLLMVVAGCDIVGDIVGVKGSGDVVTESREVFGFNEVVVRGSGVVEIELGNSESLEIEADDNLIPLLTTEVKGGRLELGVESGKRLDPTTDIVYRITAADLEGVSISGSADVTAGAIDSETFAVQISGSGNVRSTGTTGEFTVQISGSGSVYPAGTTDRLVVQISGSGDFRGEALEADSGEVDISGSGDVLVNATDELTVHISGSGDVTYMGSPRLDTSITGSGDISAQ